MGSSTFDSIERAQASGNSTHPEVGARFLLSKDLKEATEVHCITPEMSGICLDLGQGSLRREYPILSSRGTLSAIKQKNGKYGKC